MYNVPVLLTTLNLAERNHHLSFSEEWNSHLTSISVQIGLLH